MSVHADRKHCECSREVWIQDGFCRGIRWETGVRAAERPDRCLSSISPRQKLTTPWVGTDTREVIATCTRGDGPDWGKEKVSQAAEWTPVPTGT